MSLTTIISNPFPVTWPHPHRGRVYRSGAEFSAKRGVDGTPIRTRTSSSPFTAFVRLRRERSNVVFVSRIISRISRICQGISSVERPKPLLLYQDKFNRPSLRDSAQLFCPHEKGVKSALDSCLECGTKGLQSAGNLKGRIDDGNILLGGSITEFLPIWGH